MKSAGLQLVKLPPGAAPFEAQDKNLYGVNVGPAYRINLKTGAVSTLPHHAPGETLAPLMLASDGYMYGVTDTGGTSGWGTVFRMTTGGAMKTMYNFTGGTDGGAPEGRLLQGSDGNLYGTSGGTSFMGGSNNGTIFQLTLGQKTGQTPDTPPHLEYQPVHNFLHIFTPN